MTNFLAPMVLASSGGMIIFTVCFFLLSPWLSERQPGISSRRFPLPLPFTVLLLLIGLAMGALNRAYGPHGGHHAGDEANHAEHGGGFVDLWIKIVDTLSGAITWGGNLDGHLIPTCFCRF